MFMKDNKNKMATVIVAKLKDRDKEREMPMSEGAEMSEPDDMEIMADEIIMAIEKKDVKMLKDALKSFIESCDSCESEED